MMRSHKKLVQQITQLWLGVEREMIYYNRFCREKQLALNSKPICDLCTCNGGPRRLSLQVLL